MQDKEFDDLFRSKLDGFEVEPSAQVWENIGTGLDGKKRKKSLTPWLSIAASVIILITAGILFVPKKEVVKNNRHPKNSLVVNKVKPAAVKPGNIVPVAVVKKVEAIAQAPVKVKPSAKTRQPKMTTAPVAPVAKNATLITKSEPVKTDDKPVTDTEPLKANEELKPAASVYATVPVVKQPDSSKIGTNPVQPVLAAAQKPAVKTERPAVKRHGIHNIGDLVNLVVAKVDKRKDKLIEFSDTDDDESVISGLHLGGIRIKKDN